MTSLNRTFKSVSHIIFDMDGLLLDTETLYAMAFKTILERYGKAYKREYQMQVMGTNTDVISQFFVDKLALPMTYQEFTEAKEIEMALLLPSCVFMPDTEKLYEQVYRNTLRSNFRIEMPQDFRIKIMGMNQERTIELFVETFHLPTSPAELRGMFDKEFLLVLQQNDLMPGAQRLVEHLHKHKIPIAVATSSGEQSYNLKTKNHTEFFKLFNHVVLGSTDAEVKQGKPAPDIFLVCASRFPDKPKPEKCLVFEDSPNGVKGGIAAGMQVVMVPDQLLDKAQTTEATLVLKSLEDLKPEIFGLPAFK